MKELLSYNEISFEWKNSSADINAAKYLTLAQVERFESILRDDTSWNNLLEIFSKGRDIDAWLALDWPDGFDELVLCVPLCRLVDFECSRCIVGMKQEKNSCANDFSLFGYIAELLKVPDRDGLINHIDAIKKILLLDNYKWNINSKKTEQI